MHEGNIVLIEKVMQYFLTLIICHTSVRSIGNLFQRRLKTRFIGYSCLTVVHWEGTQPSAGADDSDVLCTWVAPTCAA